MSLFAQYPRKSPLLRHIEKVNAANAETERQASIEAEQAKIDAEKGISETAFFESVDDDLMLEAVSKQAETTARSNAAAITLQWIDGGEADFALLSDLAWGMVSDEDDETVSDAEQEDYNELMGFVGEFLAQCGASDELVGAMHEDEEACEAVFNAVEAATSDADDSELIADFSVREAMILEAKKKVIRDGKVKTINTKKKKRKMSSAQKQALKKARKKSHSASAKAKRSKSNRKRGSHGL